MDSVLLGLRNTDTAKEHQSKGKNKLYKTEEKTSKQIAGVSAFKVS